MFSICQPSLLAPHDTLCAMSTSSANYRGTEASSTDTPTHTDSECLRHEFTALLLLLPHRHGTFTSWLFLLSLYISRFESANSFVFADRDTDEPPGWPVMFTENTKGKHEAKYMMLVNVCVGQISHQALRIRASTSANRILEASVGVYSSNKFLLHQMGKR